MGGQLLGHLAQADALVLVVRAFEDSNVPHPEESVDALRDLETLFLEFTFSDLAIIEKRLIRIQATIPKLRGNEKEAHEREAAALERCKVALEDGTPIRDVELDPEEERLLRGFGFLTQKPVLVLLNVGEEQLGEPMEALTDQAREQFGRDGVEIQLDGNPANVVDLSQVGAQVLSGTILRPNQKVRVSIPNEDFVMRFRGSVAWAKFELPDPSAPPRYRAGVEFTDADAAAVEAFCHKNKQTVTR